MTPHEHNVEKDDLTMALARAYYTPLGWSLDDEEIDPDDLDSCRKSFEPVAALVRTMLAAAKAEALREAADVIERQTCLRETNCHKADAITLRERAMSSTPAEPCSTCGGSGSTPWMHESDPNLYQEPDADGQVPCVDCQPSSLSSEPTDDEDDFPSEVARALHADERADR